MNKPIPMVLFCPKCHIKHVDKAEESWPNPPHKSHLCAACGCIWRSCDEYTVGVESTVTHGANDWPKTWEFEKDF